MSAPGFDLTQVLRGKLAEQSVYKKYSNTVTSLVATAVNVVWVLISFGVDVPTEATVGIAVAIQALGVVGVKFTPNGVTEKQIKEIEAYAGKHRRE